MTNYQHTELSVKTIINDIETKLDKNRQTYFKLYVKWNHNSQIFYAFSSDSSLKKETGEILQEKPEQFINQLALISYQELPNKDKAGTFYKVKAIEIV
jgi:hypothetical protein